VIYAHKPIVVYNGSAVCVCFENGDKVVSLALDDSCGSMSVLKRGSIELLHHGATVTSEMFSDLAHEEDPECEFLVVPSSMENFQRAMQWLEFQGLDMEINSG
jgi:hypothetical protein